MDVLIRIKRLVLKGRVVYTRKAYDEMFRDDLTEDEFEESLVNAQAIAKTVRSRSSLRRYPGERLYVIKSLSYGGTFIYTKGAIVKKAGEEVFYILVSAKIATVED